MTRVDSAVGCHCTSGVSQRKGLSGQASQSHRLRKGVADLEMRSASTVHGLLQRSDDDTTSNNTKEGQPTDFLKLPPPPLRAATGRRPPPAKLRNVGTYYCIPTLNFCLFPHCLLDLEFGVMMIPLWITQTDFLNLPPPPAVSCHWK